MNFSENLRPSARILIVDDHDDSRVVTRLVLEHEGFTVYEASSGEEGFRLAVERQPDLMLVDVVLPGFDGLELARRIRSNRVIWNTRIIAVSALGRQTLPDEAVRAGCAAFLAKPVHIAELRRLVHEQLRFARTKGQYAHT
ncbi:MAG: response regulator [Gemmatimonadaceae bacterium]